MFLGELFQPSIYRYIDERKSSLSGVMVQEGKNAFLAALEPYFFLLACEIQHS